MDIVRKINYFKVETADRPGEGARVLSVFLDAGINLLGFTGFPQGRKAQIDFIPEDTAAFQAAAKRAKLKIGAKKSGFLVQGEDRIGAIAEIMSKLAGSKINVTAIDALCTGDGRYGALLWVKPRDIRKAAQALNAL